LRSANSLSPEEKKRVQRLQNEENKKKKGNKDKRKERRRRKAARLKLECEDASGEDDMTAEPSTSNAGAQFGSNGNHNKKQKN
jgi:hypothetical protein